MLWFATLKEITAYCYNRTNSNLKCIYSSKNEASFQLKTTISYDGDISISFKGAKHVYMNGIKVPILYTKDKLEYVNVQPINGILRFKVNY